MNRTTSGYSAAKSDRRDSGSRHRRRWRVALGAAAATVLATGGLIAGQVMTGTAPGHPAGAGRPATPGPAPVPRPAPPERLPIGTIGHYGVARHVLRLIDQSRPRLGPRILVTAVQYPVIRPPAATRRPARGRFPLVVFAPGYQQCDGAYGALLRTWASAGYVVAGVEFPRTNCHVTNPDEADLVNQPADMAYVIRRVLAAGRRPRGVLADLVNPTRIAVAGQSDGGDTVAAMAANTCCTDHRVTASIVLAGAEWPPLGGTYFAGATPPMLFVQGDADSINLPSDSITMYRADHSGQRYYLDLLGAGHLPPFEGRRPPEPIVARVTVEFLNRYLAGQRRARTAMEQAGNVPGMAALISGRHLPP